MSLARKASAVVLATAVLLGAGLTTAGAASAATDYRLVNASTGLCATPYGGHTADNTVVTQWTCSSSNSSQVWQLRSNSYGPEFYNVASGKCLTPYGGSTANGADLVLFDCKDSPFHAWAGDLGYYTNLGSGKVITTYGNSTADGADLTQWDDNSTAAQNWIMVG